MLLTGQDMPRTHRIFMPGVSVHVCQRGIDRTTLYHDDDDRRRYLDALGVYAHRYGVDVHAFTLMSNHYHLIATPRFETALEQTTGIVNWNYTTYYNRKYRRTGTRWNERPRVIALEDERQWLTCLRYVEFNPVRALMVTAPDEYDWSSYRVHALGEQSTWLVPHALYLALGRSSERRQAAYRAICSVPLSEEQLALQRRPPKPVAPALSEVVGSEP